LPNEPCGTGQEIDVIVQKVASGHEMPHVW
jgi:hypothetical protein